MAGFDMAGLFDATRRQVSDLFGGQDAIPRTTEGGAFADYLSQRAGMGSAAPSFMARVGDSGMSADSFMGRIANSDQSSGSFMGRLAATDAPFDPYATANALDQRWQAKQAQQAAEKQSTPGSGREATSSRSSSAPAGLPTDQWRGMIEQAAKEQGIDPDVLEAIMMLESSGNQKAQSPAGAMGLMQVMPFHFKAGEDPWDPATNIKVGARVFADGYKRFGSYDKAAAAYLGAIDANGNITTAQDAFGTDGFAYVKKFNDNWNQVKQARQAPQSSAPPAQSRGFATITNGQGSVMQEFGDTDYSNANSAVYEYGRQYGVTGHTGIDIGMPAGNQLYVPKDATVLNAGGTGVFCDTEGCGPGQGELRLQLADGSILILGHMRKINVQVGQRLTAGQAVGLSGASDGDHVHVEMRIRDASTPSGWRIVDARRYL